MNRAIVIGVAALTVSIASGAEAKLKIGVVDMQRAIMETKDGKAAEQTLTKRKQQLEDELNRKLKEFYKRETELRKAWSILKEDERRKRAGNSRKEFEDLQKRYIAAERELMKRKTKAMLSINNKLTVIIQGLAQKEKYDYIFANAAVLWAPRYVDLTNEVIRRYNK
ncbi:MAG: OmpH family outer membrane protein [Deltaproteobacteria bacterium]|nr:OmpH family outer membrane protein [Deltaproteobacteria bacterium]